MTDPKPLTAATEPKNLASTSTGGIAGALLVIWNYFQSQAYDKCLASTMGPPQSCIDYELPDFVVVAVALVITSITGPLLRRYEEWASTPSSQESIIAALEKMNERLKKLEGPNA